ncbi:MAG TPA: ribonuclease HI family protein [Patescibacteria group bacterium]
MKLTIFTDGGARGNPGPAGIGVVVLDELAHVVFEHSAYLGKATNNEAEYRAFQASLDWLLSSTHLDQATHISWKLDSMLVVEQLQRHWKIKEPHLKLLADQIWQKLDQLQIPYTIGHVPRAENKDADALVNQALDAHRP